MSPMLRAIGPLKTELLMKYLNTEEKRQRRLVHIPMGRYVHICLGYEIFAIMRFCCCCCRFGLADEIAKGVLFLASDDVSCNACAF